MGYNAQGDGGHRNLPHKHQKTCVWILSSISVKHGGDGVNDSTCMVRLDPAENVDENPWRDMARPRLEV